MKTLTLFLLLCHSSSAGKHSLKIISTLSSGVTNLPEFVGVVLLDDVEAGYCDSNRNTVEAKQTWSKRALDENPEQLQWYNRECFESLPRVHILQRLTGCEWDDETGEVNGLNQFGYDGEDFISLDMKTLTWIAAKPQAVVTKLSWDADKGRIKDNENFLTQICPEWLKMYLNYGKNVLLRTDLPSVSLLQKTPSSPVSCHATSFYPHRALLFWTKDGEELHEDRLGGCEWDDDTGEVTGFNQFAYDGEDFLSLDLRTETWIAAEPQT
ncbi:hypothetical protein INR49_006479, partial [Caranx melampygus]